MNDDKLIKKMEELKRVETEVMDYPAGWNDAITKCIALVKEQGEDNTVTSRGCPNCCWFCSVWKREGNLRTAQEIKQRIEELKYLMKGCTIFDGEQKLANINSAVIANLEWVLNEHNEQSNTKVRFGGTP